MLDKILSAAGTAFLKSVESCRLTAYMDLRHGKWTIGYGHTIGVEQGMMITQEHAEALFKIDLEVAEKEVNRVVTVSLTDNQYAALVAFQFNTGRLPCSTLVRKLNRGDSQGAANELDRWIWATNKDTGEKYISDGLVSRRAKEKALFLSAPA